MNTKTKFAALMAAVTLAASAAFAQAEVIYIETFGSSSSSPTYLGAINTDWQYYRDWTPQEPWGVVNYTNTESQKIVMDYGNPTSDWTWAANNVGTGQSKLGIGAGLIRTDAFRFMLNTTVFTADLSLANQNLTFSWLQWTTDASSSSRVIIQANGHWYASDQSFSGAVAGVNPTVFTFNFTKSASAWHELTVDATTGTSGTGITFASETIASDLVLDSITGFGLLGTNYKYDPISAKNITLGSFYIDTFAIHATAVPELSTLAFLAGLGAIGFALVVRRVNKK